MSCNLILLFLWLLSLLIFQISASPLFLNSVCNGTYHNQVNPNTTTLVRNSTYQVNRNTLLSSLASGAPHNNKFSIGFYNDTAGQEPDKVYGIFLCRGDVNSTTCKDCVSYASKDVTRICPVEEEAVIWYEECLLRYSNKSFFSVAYTDPAYKLMNPNTSTHTEQFDTQVQDFIGETATDTMSSPKKFATRSTNITLPSEPLYSLAQCTPDLSKTDCDMCLRLCIAYFPLGNLSIGGRVYCPSCYVRYEIYPFYHEMVAAPPPMLPSNPPVGSEATHTGLKGRKTQGRKTWIVVGVSTSAIVLVVLFGLLWRMLRNDRKEEKLYNQDILRLGEEYSLAAGEKQVESLDFPLLPLGLLLEATQNFSQENKLGEGGFGPVYKGVLPDGKELAVKRLSKASAQGLKEFKNEVHLIAKLQHKNLVRLLGCCLEGDELMLVYEYMPNKSLDVFLFDPTWGAQLDWKRRISIINGIARGILYLHEDSRLKIIHRDLKASNVLLDHEMNPKISDFGMARIFCGNQFEANTNRIVGTYGYMSPEYAMEGLFSIKSDVFSFGVLLLEIVSGKRNNRFHLAEEGQNLLTYTWKLWCEGEAMEVLDPTLAQSCVHSEALKCINIGLLCVQEDPADRPTMSYVVHMLGSDTMTLPRPNQPAFSVGRVVVRGSESSSDVKICSANQVTISTLSPR